MAPEPAEYRCGTCESRGLHITAVPNVISNFWQITCLNGHVLVPVPGQDLVISNHVTPRELVEAVRNSFQNGWEAGRRAERGLRK
jgi:hypothetical protein